MNTDKSLSTETANSIDYQNLAKETLRLCQVEKKSFEEILQLPIAFNTQTSDDNSNQPKEYFQKEIANIENELQKLEKMEVVIAFVGTMKAGKSTTINAIVGTEILPNRNAPMTTLPTLIRNKHGQTDPVLKLSKLEPLETLSQEIAKQLKELKADGKIEEVDIYTSNDGLKLITDLIDNKGYQFKPEYQGQKQIFEFLKHLNDLMRLAKDELIGIEPPYHEYENLNDLPVIEIEFYHLKDKAESAQGSLAILDTPGPNEFGQSESLRKIFKNQLEKASAVGLVIDYTQMKSVSEAAVRKEVTDVIENLTKDSLYLLVNKFDQTDRHSMNKDEVKEFVVKTLMENKITHEQVYPVSSQRAYLANRAKYNLETHGKLPNPTDEPWVEDFGQIGMGVDWDEEIDNNEKVQSSANKLWQKSYFDAPLNGIICEAHSSAAKKSIESAITKLSAWNNELYNHCSAINTYIGTDIKNIENAIEIIENNIDKLKNLEKQIDERIKDSSAELKISESLVFAKDF